MASGNGSKKPVVVVIGISVATAIAVGAVNSDMIVWPWTAYAKKEAKEAHAAMIEHDERVYQRKERHDSDQRLLEQRIRVQEESTKALMEFTNKVDEKLDRVIWEIRKVQ